MNFYFKPSNLLFYVLLTIIFFFVGMFLAAITGAAKGQGLAGGAIILGYGVMSAGIAFIASIVLVKLIPHIWIIRINKVFLILAVILIALLIIRHQLQQKDKQHAINQTNFIVSPLYAATTKTYKKIPMGLGMAKPDFFNHKEVYFYNRLEPNKSILDHTHNEKIVIGRSETGFSIQSAPPWFSPAHLKIDYEILYLRVVSVTPEFIEVVVNEQTGQTAYMDRRKSTLLHWPEFLLSLNSIEPISKKQNPIKIKPLDHASPVNKAYAFLKPLKVKQQWVQVELVDRNYKTTGKGWLKWNNQQKLLIKYSLLS